MYKLNFYWVRLALAGMLLSLVAACTSIDLETGFTRDEDMHGRILDQDEDRFAHIDPLFLDDEARQLVDSHIRATDSTEVRVRKLQEILYDEEFLNIQYSDEKTHTAMEAFYAGEGNCLSVMNLYVAMARYAGVNASFQTVQVRPSWNRQGDLLVLSEHINATGRVSFNKHYVVDFTPDILLQQLTASRVTDRHARALYFNNLGVEEQIKGDDEAALVYYKNALFLEPELSIAWNNVGATYNRLGQFDLAEYSYQMAFSTSNKNATAINNLAKFYRAQGNGQLAREYEEAIRRFNNQNPYYHFTQGQIMYTLQDLDAARRAFSRALRLKEVEPDFYLALAQVNRELGYTERAEELTAAAAILLAENTGIYRPSNQRLRIIDTSTILKDSSPGIRINVN